MVKIRIPACKVGEWWHGVSPRLGVLCPRVLYRNPCEYCRQAEGK
jgi:hypothetical protein